MKHKTPSHYVAPLRARAAILAFLKTAQDDRPQYGLFAFNVKLYNVDLDFDHLVKLAKESGELAANVSARYLDACHEKHAEERENLYNWAIESARDGICGDSTHRILWDGNDEIAEWSFAGRSGGWLVLESFEGVQLAPTHRHAGDPWENIEIGMSFPQLRRLYRFIVQCQHDFRREAMRSEVEYAAAFNLFANVCANVETDEQATDREARERRESEERAHWEARDTVTA